MLEILKGKKKLIIIVVVILLLLIIGFCIYWFLIKKDSESAKDLNTGNEITTEKQETIPDYVANDLSEIYSTVLADLSSWASDFRIHAITAMTKSTEINGERVFYGTESGKFSSWVFEVYSPSKKASVMYSYSNGKGDLGEEMLIDDEYILPSYNSREYFNDLGAIKPTQEVYDVAINSGLITGDINHIYMYLGDSKTTNVYGSRYVWRIDERSNTQVGEYDIPLVTNTYYVDGKTLAVL